MNSSKELFFGASNSKAILDKEMLKFTLALYNNPLLSRKAVDDVIKMFDDFISDLLIPYIQNQVQNDLKAAADIESYHRIQFLLENNKRIFNKFSTEHLRFNIYKNESLYVAPNSFDLGQESVFISEGDEVKVGTKTCHAVQVPLKDTLQAFFQTPGLFNEMSNYYQELSKDTTFLSNFVNGKLWLENYCLKNEGKIVFPIFIYFDEFEVGNALGSHAGEQKLGGLFASLTCLPPHLVAKLENIFVLTLCYAKDLKKFGNKAIFGKSINDLNDVSDNGIEVTVDGKTFTVYFQCVLVLGDNLALNCICGFTEGFNANFYCRICSANAAQCKKMTVVAKDLLRTTETYERDLLINDFSLTGIKERCVFNMIKNFDITMNQAVDFMHDGPEGFVVCSLENCVKQLIKEVDELNIDVINSRIETFPYSEAEKSNKPRPLYFTQTKGGKKLKIKQSAAEMLCLARYLGLMIGDLIPPNNKTWKLYQYLRQILSFVTSPKLSKGEIQNLKDLIQKHHSLYIETFGDLTPKMHLWVHYVDIMFQNGPVIHFSSFMFERKNKKLKEMALPTTSNINLPYSVAIRHQLQLCYMKEICENVSSYFSLGPIKNSNALIDLKKICANAKEIPTTTLKYVDIIGKKFSIGTVFVSVISEEGPRFGIVKEIFHQGNEILFYFSEYETLYFNHYYHCYTVQSIGVNRIIEINSIPKLALQQDTIYKFMNQHINCF